MTSQLVGTVLLFRHGDRQGFYQSPSSYTPSETAITPLGEQQEYQLGQLIRSRYINPSSPNYIQNFNSTLLNNAQIYFSADAGGEGGVIYDSAVALTQGAWPATSISTTTLANGTTITSPLGGYQYVSIESVEPDEDYTLESWTECPAYTADNNAWYASAAFKAKAEEAAPFLNSLGPIVGGRNVTLSNMWNIFDYINVNYIHSASFMQETPLSTLEQARDLANWHEYTSFSDPKPGAIGNIAGRAMLPQIIDALNEIRNSSNPLLMRGIGISYKPFISLFNMTQTAQVYPQLAGVVNYAAAMALEVRHETVTDSYTVTMNFKNGTDDADFVPYNMFTSSNAAYPLDQFISTLEPYGISSLGQWCNECQNTYSRGCALISEYNETTSYTGASSTLGRHHTSPLAAGFIGAVVALAAAATVLGIMWLLGMLAVGKKGFRQGSRHQRSESYSLPAYDRKYSSAEI